VAGFYRGGPCDGLPALGAQGALRVCGGATYALAENGNYYPAPQEEAGTAALGAHAPRGWANLQRSVNRKLPTALHRSQAIRRATLRAIGRRKRVR
jgi:hypothetical protein